MEGGLGGLRRIIELRENYRLILKGQSIDSLWPLFGGWNTTTAPRAHYGKTETGQEEEEEEEE